VWYTGTTVLEESAAFIFRAEEMFYPEDGGSRITKNRELVVLGEMALDSHSEGFVQPLVVSVC
jgi:hypothetical protein